MRSENRVIHHFLSPSDAEKVLPVLIGIRKHCDETVLGRVGTPFRVHNSLVTHLRDGRVEGRAIKLLDHAEIDKRLVHGDFDSLAAATAFALHERGQDGC